MASIPVRSAPSVSKSVGYERVSPLFEKKITVSYQKASSATRSRIELTVGEIYTRCQRRLCENLGKEVRLLIKGSSVAGLYSEEPSEDIDIHCVADLTHIPDGEKIRRGYDLKWTVLRSVAEIIESKEEESAPVITESLITEESSNFMFNRGRGPFNVFNLRFGEIPIEFTLLCQMTDVESFPRSFDFNSGALELSFREGEGFVLHSGLEDIDAVIDGISKKELFTSSPEMITRKGVCRYLAKIVISGYTDKDPSLLEALLQSTKKARPGQSDEEAASFLFKEITDHFKEKKIDPQIAYLSLWLMRAETPMQKALSKIAKEACVSSTLPPHLRSLADKGKKSEGCWQLLMLARGCKKVMHRGEESLQIEIEHSRLFPGVEEGRGVYLTLPIAGIKKFTEVTDPEFFLHLHSHPIALRSLDAATKLGLQDIFKETLVSSSLYPVLTVVLQKFEIETTKQFSGLFFDWYNNLSEGERAALPFSIIARNLAHISDDVSLRPDAVMSLIRSFAMQVGAEQLAAFEEPLKQKPISTFVMHFLRSDKFERLSQEDRKLLIKLARVRIKDLLSKTPEQRRASAQSDAGHSVKLTWSMTELLYSFKEAPVQVAVSSAAHAAELGHLPYAMRLLQAVIATEKTALSAHSQEQILQVANLQPKEFYDLVKKNPETISAIIDIKPHIDLLQERALSETSSSESTDLFFEILDLLGSEEQKFQIRKVLFYKEAHGDKNAQRLMTLVRKRDSLNVLSFPWIKEMDVKELELLCKERGFDEQIRSSSVFLEALTLRALELGMEDKAIEWATLLAPSSLATALASLSSYIKSPRSAASEITVIMKLINTIIQHHPGLTAEAHFRDILQESCSALASHLESVDSRTLDAALKEQIRIFHTLALAPTFTHPLWQIVWKKFLPHESIEAWTDQKTIQSILPLLPASEKVDPLIKAMSKSSTACISLIHAISQLAEEERKSYKDITHTILRNCWSALGNNPPEASVEGNRAAEYVYSIFCEASGDAPSRFSMDELFFCMSCGSSSLRRCVVDHLFDRIVPYMERMKISRASYRSFVDTFKDTPSPEQIFFTGLDRALEEENIDEILYLRHKFRNIIRCELDAKESVLTRIANSPTHLFERRCRSWQTLLNKLFKDNPTLEPSDGSSKRIQVLSFYSDYVVENLVAQNLSNIRSGAFSTIENLPALPFLLGQLDFIAKKKSTHMVDSTALIITSVKSLPRPILELITQKYFHLATVMILAMQKKEVSKEQKYAYDTLINYSIFLLAQLDSGFDPKTIRQLLEVARSTYSLFEVSKTPSRNDVVDAGLVLYVLESHLDRENIESYYLDWMKSIVERKDKVMFGELILFTMLTFRLDAKYLVKLKGPDADRFRGKTLITDKWFKKPSISKHYLEIFDILFSRFSDRLLPPSSVVKINTYDPFSLFHAYKENIENYIKELTRARDPEKLGLRYLDCVSPLIKLAPHILLPDAIKIVIERIVRADDAGEFVLQQKHPEPGKTKGNSREDLLLFYFCIVQIPLIPKSFFLTLTSDPFEKTQKLFVKLIPEINKALGSDHVRQMQQAFEEIDRLRACYISESTAAKDSERYTHASEESPIDGIMGMASDVADFADVFDLVRGVETPAGGAGAGGSVESAIRHDGVRIAPEHGLTDVDIPEDAMGAEKIRLLLKALNGT